MSALSRVLLCMAFGAPADPDDADELGHIFDAAPLYGQDWPAIINGHLTRPRLGRCPGCDVAENRYCDLTCSRLDPMDHR